MSGVGECRTAEMLGSSNIVGLVGCSTDRSTFDEDSGDVCLADVDLVYFVVCHLLCSCCIFFGNLVFYSYA